MCRGNYLPADQYLNHAEKSDMTIVEAFKRMQVVQHEEPQDVAEENGELDQQVSHMHSASIAHFLRLSILLLWI